MTAAENISQNVRRLRRLAGWKQTEAAERFARISDSEPMSMASWSAGEQVGKGRQRSWSANEIVALAQLFDVTVADLFSSVAPSCKHCGDVPPIGFTCNTCGATR